MMTLQPGATIDDSLLKHFFLAALPENVRAILAINTGLPSKDLAIMADKIMMVVNPNIEKNVAAVSVQPQDAIINALQKITERLDRLETNRTSSATNNTDNFRSRNPPSFPYSYRSRESSPSFQRNRNASPNRGTLCYYHYKFRSQARRCNLGCTWLNINKECVINDICIHHAKYRENANQCITGCKYAQHQQPKN